MAIKMSGSIPADNNGLSTIYGALISDPQRQHVVIAVVDTGKLTTDTDTGVVSPTVRIHHAEVVLPESIPAARAMMQRALEARTGQLDLPFPEPFASGFGMATFSGVTTSPRNGGDDGE